MKDNNENKRPFASLIKLFELKDKLSLAKDVYSYELGTMDKILSDRMDECDILGQSENIKKAREHYYALLRELENF